MSRKRKEKSGNTAEILGLLTALVMLMKEIVGFLKAIITK